MQIEAGTLDSVESRSSFIVRTYAHLLGAALTFVAIEVGLFSSGLALPIARTMLGTSWLLVLGAFVIVAGISSRYAHTIESSAGQYLALSAYIAAEALIFVPLLYVAESRAPGVIASSGLVAVLGFSALTGIAFYTRQDFSFLRPFLYWAGLVALALIVAAVLTGFSLGSLFSIAMVGVAGGAILYDTSNVLHHYRPHQHVAAALELFSSFALLLWYLISLGDD